MAFFTVGFFLFLSYCMIFLVDQTEPRAEDGDIKAVALTPLATVKLTIDTLSKIHYLRWPMNFKNYHFEKDGWSIKLGINAFITNFIVYTIVGIVIDILFNYRSLPCIKHNYKRVV